MSGLLPSSSEPEPPDGDPRVIGVDDEDAGAVVSALSSDTARELFATLHDKPATPSELADQTETSLQNAQYHLEKLEEADLIDVVDTRYSAKGREMNVYGPSGAPVVLFAGGEDTGTDVRSALTSLLGGVGVLGIASLAVQRFLGPGAVEAGGGGGGDSGAAPATTEASEDVGIMAAEETAVPTVTESAQYQLDAVTGATNLPPGLLFFIGGALVLALAAVWWYVHR